MKDRYQACEMCGGIMMPNSLGVCSNCIEEDKKQFDIVRSALRMNEIRSVDEISEATGVSIKHIRRWLKRGRLQGSES